jgi:hypothetical protein
MHRVCPRCCSSWAFFVVWLFVCLYSLPLNSIPVVVRKDRTLVCLTVFVQSVMMMVTFLCYLVLLSMVVGSMSMAFPSNGNGAAISTSASSSLRSGAVDANGDWSWSLAQQYMNFSVSCSSTLIIDNKGNTPVTLFQFGMALYHNFLYSLAKEAFRTIQVIFVQSLHNCAVRLCKHSLILVNDRLPNRIV